MWTSIKQEFKLRHFLMDYEQPYHFYTSTIEKPKHFYLIWRMFWFLFHCGGIIAIFLHSPSPYLERLLAFATVWGYLCLSSTTLLDLIFVILFQYVWPSSRQEKHQNYMPWYFKVCWFMSNLAYDGSWLITIAYWILLYHGILVIGNQEDRSQQIKEIYISIDETQKCRDTQFEMLCQGAFLGVNIMEHAINSVYTLLNIFITNKPVRILHFWHLFSWMFIYIIFLGIYYSAGGLSLSGHRYIYPFMNFEQPKKMAIYVFGLAVACPIIHCFIFLLYRTRLWLVQKYKQHIQSVNDLSSSRRDLEIVT